MALRTIRLVRPGHGSGFAVTLIISYVVLLGVTSCGRYFSAEIAGYVKDSDNETGVDGAVIRIYHEEPESANADGFIVETASITSGGNPGYFSHRIIWQKLFPEFGAEGDTGSLFLGITHADYLPTVTEVRGVLSDTLNLVPDVRLDRATFVAPRVTGLVVDPTGAGVDGVRVVLDLVSTEDETSDYVAFTGEVEGVTGTYEFEDVTWRDDEAAGSGSDTETATISVEDPDYSSPANVSVSLVSDVEIIVSDSITALDAEYLVPRVSGRVLDAAGAPINGVRVVLDLASTDGAGEDEDYVVNTALVEGEDGVFDFTDVRWEDPVALESLLVEDTESATLRIDDNEYEAAAPVDVTLTSDEEYELATDISVSRIDSTSFEVTVVGRCIERYGTAPDLQDIPAQGIEVSCAFEIGGTTNVLYDQTDANGEYSFFIQWTDATPRDFEEGTPDTTIPVGEDGIIVELGFATPFENVSFDGSNPGVYELPSSPTDPRDDRQIKSWLAPNYVPDAVVNL